MKRILAMLFGSAVAQLFLTTITYAVYAALIGVSLIPSVLIVARAWRAWMTDPAPAGVLLFSVSCGAALFAYFFTGVCVMGIVIRLCSLGIKPGRYPTQSFTMIRWLVYSGVYHIAGSTILTYVPMGFVTMVFFRLVGARFGRNVVLNTWYLNDAYLLEVGDNVVIGGKTDISCHTFEKGFLILQPVKIGRDSMVGQRCYISPGVTIGERCLIGQYAFVRKGKVIPDRTVISAVAGLPIRAVTRLEKMGEQRTEKSGGNGPGDGDGGGI